jgi:hypothetical protein
MTHFSLIPFPDNCPHPEIEITGQIERLDQQLSINFQLTGEIEKIAVTKCACGIAPPDENPSRRNELWQTTCFEFFLGLEGSPKYWEFNLSPAGHWNIYRFDDYRQGMTEELAFQSFPFLVKDQSDSLTLSLDLDLETIISSTQALEVGITTVIQSKINELISEQNSITYWALTHVGKEADFHQRKSFMLNL